MTLKLGQWKEILTLVSGLGESNVVEKIKEKLQQENLDTYQEWRKCQFDIDHIFKIQSSQDFLDATLLHIAASTGCQEVVKALFMAKANINVRNSHRSTPLHEAATNDKKEVLEFLLTNGADVDARDRNGRTPLHEAIISGAEDAVALLVEYGANVNAQDLEGLTPISAATADNIDNKIVSVLVNAGTDINIVDCDGDTLLHLIAGDSSNEGAEEIVRLLIERGINVNVQNRKNRTPLHCAIETGGVETVQLLVEEYKANVNAMDHNRNTPIHLLYKRIDATECIKSGIEMVKILIENGASFNVPNKEGKTFLHEIVADECNISEHYGNNDYYELVRAMVEYTILENPEAEKPYYVMAKEEISECWDEVSDEIEKMRARNIGGGVTFYDILVSKDINELASYVQNKNITTELEAKNYKSQFPTYANKIESQFHKGKIRKELLDKGEESIGKLVSIGRGIGFPQLICRKTVQYLPNEDIENLNKTAENLLDKRGIKRKASFEEGESSTKHFAASRAEEPNSNLNDISEENLNEGRNNHL